MHTLDPELPFRSRLMSSAQGAWPARMKLFPELLRMDDPTFAALLLGGNDELLRHLASKLNQRAKSLLTYPEPSRTPQSTRPEERSLQQQLPMNNIQLLISHDLPEASSANRDAPKLSQVILLSELPSELRSQLLDFLHRRESERFSELPTEMSIDEVNDSEADVAQGSKAEDKGSMKAPKFFHDLGLSGWHLKERRDAYRLAIAAGLRTLTQAGFDLESSWTTHSEEERENAKDLFRTALKGILGYVPTLPLLGSNLFSDSGDGSMRARNVCETYLKEKCRQGAKDKRKSSRSMAADKNK